MRLNTWKKGIAPTVMILLILIFGALAHAQDEDRPYMGIRLAPDGTVGIVVTEVVIGEPADEAGILPNDILVTIDGDFLTVDNALDLIGAYSPGDTASFELLRDDETLTLDLTFGTFPEEVPEAASTEEAEDSDAPRRARLGVAIDAIDGEGALVSTVAVDTAADAAGIEIGDIITAVDDTEITSPNDLIAAIGEYFAGDVIDITLLRDDEELTLEVELGAAPESDEQTFIPIPRGVTYNADVSAWAVSGDELGEFGIEDGDIITAINGETVDSLNDAFEVLQIAILEDGATLTIQRGDEDLEVNVPVDVVISLAGAVE